VTGDALGPPDADGDTGANETGGASDAGGADATGPIDASGEDAPQVWTVLVAPNGSHTFTPAALSVHAGDTVHWVWQQSGHTVTSGPPGTADDLFCSPGDTGCSSSPTSSAGSTYDHVFATAGTYPYFCRIHWDAGMVGAITVQ
ncbi:MAG: cupredoxin domain-containing protein, partial [Polyangiaceae bacterium]